VKKTKEENPISKRGDTNRGGKSQAHRKTEKIKAVRLIQKLAIKSWRQKREAKGKKKREALGSAQLNRVGERIKEGEKHPTNGAAKRERTSKPYAGPKKTRRRPSQVKQWSICAKREESKKGMTFYRGKGNCGTKKKRKKVLRNIDTY